MLDVMPFVVRSLNGDTLSIVPDTEPGATWPWMSTKRCADKPAHLVAERAQHVLGGLLAGVHFADRDRFVEWLRGLASVDAEAVATDTNQLAGAFVLGDAENAAKAADSLAQGVQVMKVAREALAALGEPVGEPEPEPAVEYSSAEIAVALQRARRDRAVDSQMTLYTTRPLAAGDVVPWVAVGISGMGTFRVVMDDLPSGRLRGVLEGAGVSTDEWEQDGFPF